MLSELNCDRARAFSCTRSAVSMSAGWLGLVLILRLGLLQQTDQLVRERPETRLLKTRKYLCQVESFFAPMDQPVGPGKTSGQTIGKKNSSRRCSYQSPTGITLLEVLPIFLLVETEFPYTIATIESLAQRQLYFIG
jgi:hypothetical protein